ncbi:MAG TPA: S8 family serine peptidase [Gemmatimonadales bacterium]
MRTAIWIVLASLVGNAPAGGSAAMRNGPLLSTIGQQRGGARAATTHRAASLDTTHRVVEPADAFRTGLMALHSAGVDNFAVAHPTFDGRGILIAILDSGIDPGIPGLQLSSDSASKILDLRDFSGEGRIALRPIVRRGDTLVVGTQRLLGASRVAAVATGATMWGGMLDEARLGQAPAADVNGNHHVGDSLAIVVVNTQAGWAMFADTQGDGTLANDHPIHDFAVAHEYFGWAPAGLAAPVDFVANFTADAGAPELDLVFDTFGHGTHVAGIAAGHDLYGVAGFDGVAPGARLIGLKIADDAYGAVTVTGSMLRALEYAIASARRRQMPLVINLSFGVGNEVDGTARIDAMIDSVLLANPDVVMTVAAGNDGPGLSTIGFPGSASRVISVGATLPLSFAGTNLASSAVEPVAPFSSRGAEIAGPDIVVPGAAYSTIPNFAIGNEEETGTSMAAPYAAGLAARLLSGLRSSGRTAPGRMIRQALRSAGHVLPSGSIVDEGMGLPDLTAAWEWLSHPHEVADLAVDVGSVHGRGAVFLTAEPGVARALGARVVVRRLDGNGPLTLHLHASAPWIQVPEAFAISAGRGEFTVGMAAGAADAPGVVVGSVEIDGPDASAGPIAVVPVTVRTPIAAGGTRTPLAVTMPAGGVGRVFVPVDTGRGFQVEIGMSDPSIHGTASLHEPGGMPFRDGPSVAAGFGTAAGMFDVGGSDVVNGVYEVDAVAPPATAASATVAVRLAPLRLSAAMQRDTLLVTARNLVAAPLSVRLRAGLIGAERQIVVQRNVGGEVRVVVPIPPWATHLVLDTDMSRDQWSRFTDFGLSVFDRRGREIDVSPINYATSRAVVDLPDSVSHDSLAILLSPAFAEANPSTPWSINLTFKYYVDTPYSLDGGGSSFKTVAAGELREERFTPDAAPVPIPDGFLPLITVVALEGPEHIWTRELPIARWTGHQR